MNTKITGSGSYIPRYIKKNAAFLSYEFLNTDGSEIARPTEVIIEKFKKITGIEERRYASKDIKTSDMAFFAAEKAIADADLDMETLDYVIVAHNFGDIDYPTSQSDMVPSLAARVKHKLRIKNPYCVAYDILFGCPGWIEGMIQAQAFIKSGMANKCLVIGAETLSRVLDKHDRDSMIYADGAGATIVEGLDSPGGIIASLSASYTLEEATFLFNGKTYNQKSDSDQKYIKMYGRKIYEFALTAVPLAMKNCLKKSNLNIADVSKILIHQANEKMDEAIVDRLYKLYNMETPKDIMPMSIQHLGNSSVATIPTLYDLIIKGNIENQSFKTGDVLLFASVGAGMNINAFTYRF